MRVYDVLHMKKFDPSKYSVKKDRKIAFSHQANHLKEKLVTGGDVGGASFKQLRIREMVMNHDVREEGRKEMEAIKAKRLLERGTCKCGNRKPYKYTECFACHEKRVANTKN